VTILTVVADDNDRKAYLNRAKALLEQKGPLTSSSSSLRLFAVGELYASEFEGGADTRTVGTSFLC
jgi:hypothetical protein